VLVLVLGQIIILPHQQVVLVAVVRGSQIRAALLAQAVKAIQEVLEILEVRMRVVAAEVLVQQVLLLVVLEETVVLAQQIR
jgi:hypothetical protein